MKVLMIRRYHFILPRKMKIFKMEKNYYIKSFEKEKYQFQNFSVMKSLIKY